MVDSVDELIDKLKNEAKVLWKYWIENKINFDH
jgi:hypothetical protein